MLQEKYRLDVISLMFVARTQFTVGSVLRVTAGRGCGGHAVQYMAFDLCVCVSANRLTARLHRPQDEEAFLVLLSVAEGFDVKACSSAFVSITCRDIQYTFDDSACRMNVHHSK